MEVIDRGGLSLENLRSTGLRVAGGRCASGEEPGQAGRGGHGPGPWCLRAGHSGTFAKVNLGSAMEIFPGISMNPDVRFGKPCISGTRMDVATVVGLIAAGETVETVVDEYQLSVEQVRSALSYAAHVAAHLPPAVRQAS